jgi:hypothetical protein
MEVLLALIKIVPLQAQVLICMVIGFYYLRKHRKYIDELEQDIVDLKVVTGKLSVKGFFS